MKKISNTPDEKSEIVFDPTSLKVHYKIGGENVEKRVEIPKTAEEGIDDAVKGLSKSDVPSPQNKSGYGGYAGRTKESEGMRDGIEPVEVSGFSHFEQRADADSKAFKELVDSVEGMDFDPLPEEGIDKKASLEKKSLMIGGEYSEEDLETSGFVIDQDEDGNTVAVDDSGSSYLLEEGDEETYRVVQKMSRKLSATQKLQSLIEKFSSSEKSNLYPGWNKEPESASLVAELISLKTGISKEILSSFILKNYKPSKEGV